MALNYIIITKTSVYLQFFKFLCLGYFDIVDLLFTKDGKYHNKDIKAFHAGIYKIV